MCVLKILHLCTRLSINNIPSKSRQNLKKKKSQKFSLSADTKLNADTDSVLNLVGNLIFYCENCGGTYTTIQL